MGAWQGVSHVRGGPGRAVRPVRGAASTLGRGARQAARTDADVQEQGRLQLRHGVALPGCGHPAGAVRAGGPAAGGAFAPAGVDAAGRRTYRSSGGGRRTAGADRADEAVRHRDLVRRPGGGAGVERVGQVAFSAAAGPRGLVARARQHLCRPRLDRAGALHRGCPAGGTGASGVVRPDPRPPRIGRPHAGRDPAPRRRPS